MQIDRELINRQMTNRQIGSYQIDTKIILEKLEIDICRTNRQINRALTDRLIENYQKDRQENYILIYKRTFEYINPSLLTRLNFNKQTKVITFNRLTS